MLEEMNPNKKKLIIAGIAVLCLVGVGYYLYKKKKEKKDDGDALDQAISDARIGSSETKANNKTEADLLAEAQADTSFPLKMGKEGKRVSQLQAYIEKEHNPDLLSTYGVDGVFGNETLSAVQDVFKRDNVSKTHFIERKMYKY
mgnify:CR=1 FL=1